MQQGQVGKGLIEGDSQYTPPSQNHEIGGYVFWGGGSDHKLLPNF